MGTSGIVALMFQKKPTLTLGEVKTLLKANATKTGLNPFGSGVPNNNTACNQHPNTVAQNAMGALLTARLKSLLGW